MQSKIIKFLDNQELEYQNEVIEHILTSDIPVIYINKTNNDVLYSYKLETIYRYCYKHKYPTINLYYDDDSNVGKYSQYQQLLESISEGCVDKVIFYSLDDICDDIYKLLYQCKIHGTKIELVSFDDTIEYSSEYTDLLEYIANIEE